MVFGASEVLTGETRRRVEQAWGRLPFDVYAATETAGGRIEEALSFPTRSGGRVTVQPAVFHGVRDAVPAEGWQIPAIPRTALGKTPLVRRSN